MTAAASGRAGGRRVRLCGRLGRVGGIVLAAAVAASPLPPPALSQPVVANAPPLPAVPEGVWLMDGRVAVQIFRCEGLMCGRIVWLEARQNPHTLANLDEKNPVPALRTRKLCGLTILWGLRPTGPNRWADGWFYNPEDGKSYSVTARLKSPDVIVARIYVGVPLLGKTKTLARVPHDTTEGWC